VRISYALWGRNLDGDSPTDSVTLLLAERDTLPMNFGFLTRYLRIGVIIGPDSAWMLYRPAALTPSIRRQHSTPNSAEWDSVLIGTRPTELSTNYEGNGLNYWLMVVPSPDSVVLRRHERQRSP
jgi:hypothetical protein